MDLEAFLYSPAMELAQAREYMRRNPHPRLDLISKLSVAIRMIDEVSNELQSGNTPAATKLA